MGRAKRDAASTDTASGGGVAAGGGVASGGGAPASPGALALATKTSVAPAAVSRPAPAPVPRPAPRPGDRLLTAPVFILSSVRSGSTLLRVLLDTHSRVHAPHELHLRSLKVQLADSYVIKAMNELGADADELRYLLWDRLLHRELVRHGKQVLVNKTPSDVFIWKEIRECWPDARFIYLLRNPVAVADSWHRARPEWSREDIVTDVAHYVTAVQYAKQSVDGLTVRYEELTEDPEGTTKTICAYLGLEWEPAMMDYGDADHGRFRAGLGDWSGAIKSGRVQPARPIPTDDLTPELAELNALWGYPCG